MKFGEKFEEYLHGEDEEFLNKCSHVDYKRLKKVLKKCRLGVGDETSATSAGSSTQNDEFEGSHDNLCLLQEHPEGITGDIISKNCSDNTCDVSKPSSSSCSSSACPVCDKIFFVELAREVSSIVGCFSWRARRLLQLHLASGFQRYLWRVRHFFANDHKAMIREGRHLVSYVAMNAIAIRKILKKYDKVHRSVNGRDFKSKLQAKRIELLKSPWLIELCAFQINARDSGDQSFGEIFPECSCNFTDGDPCLTCTIPDSVKLEFNLSCPICLEIVFDPVALGCGHTFCNICACTGACVSTIEGVKSANRRARCPICRQMGVYADSVHLVELGLLVKKRCKDYWKERLHTERAQRVKQAKEHWDLQSRFLLGF